MYSVEHTYLTKHEITIKSGTHPFSSTFMTLIIISGAPPYFLNDPNEPCGGGGQFRRPLNNVYLH